MRVSAELPDRKWQLMQLTGVWFFSLMLIVYPCFQKLRIFHFPSEDVGSNLNEHVLAPDTLYTAFCMFSNSLMYDDIVIGISFGMLSIVIPLILITFFYIRIFKHVRSVRINRWLNHVAAQRGRQTRVIKSHGRKANVFQVSMTPIASSDRNFDTIAYSRERSILFKGIFSLCVVVACWVPCTSLLIYLSSSGFDSHYVKYLKYVVLIAKLSVPANIVHFICFNVRYRKLYGQSLLGLFKRMCPSFYSEATENTSIGDSHAVPSSQCYREAILSSHPTGIHMLPPIVEPPRSPYPSTHDVLETIQTHHRPMTPSRQDSRAQRTKSMPMCLKRSGAVAPIT